MSRWSRLLAWAGLMVIIGWIPLLVGWSHLPDPAATHWGINGLPDANMPLWALPLLIVFMVGVGLATTSLFRYEGRPSAEAFAMIGLMGGLGLALMVSLVALNWDAASWQEAESFSWLHLIGALIGAGAGGTIGYSLGCRWYPPPALDAAISPVAVEVAPGESVHWIAECRVRWPLIILGGVAVMSVLLLPS